MTPWSQVDFYINHNTLCPTPFLSHPPPPQKKTYCFYTKKKVIENNAYANEQSLPLTICLYDYHQYDWPKIKTNQFDRMRLTLWLVWKYHKGIIKEKLSLGVRKNGLFISHWKKGHEPETFVIFKNIWHFLIFLYRVSPYHLHIISWRG